jgi:ribose 5-phosphate isomerase A
MTTDLLADAAIEPIEPGMLVGLGTGRAAARGVQSLALRVAQTGLKVTCVATSRATEKLATELGLRLAAPSGVSQVDYLFDGADEVDPGLRMTKGGGGAMTRERIVASMAVRRVYMIDAAKLVPRLGARARLPVEVLVTARQLAARRLEELGLEGVYRVLPGGREEFLTDNGALVVDCVMPESMSGPAPLHALAARLREIPGVVDHGLFLHECDELLIEPAGGGAVERRVRRS